MMLCQLLRKPDVVLIGKRDVGRSAGLQQAIHIGTATEVFLCRKLMQPGAVVLLELRKQGLSAIEGAVITHQQALGPERLPMD